LTLPQKTAKIIVEKLNQFLTVCKGHHDHVQRLSAKHGVKDDFAFLWEHAIFRRPPNKNALTDRSEILRSWLRRRDH
jgi:hypothetical protein